MILISPRTAENLYWMGRYIQRAESMTRLVISTFDKILDQNPDEGNALYQTLGLNVAYQSPQDFLRKAVIELEHVSLLSIIECARENAILMRPSLPNRMFNRINALYIKYQAAKEDMSCISIFWLESTLQELDAIWGNLDLSLLQSKEIPYIQLGKIIEKIDLDIRLFDSLEAAILDVEKVNVLASKLCVNHKKFTISTSNKLKVLHKINSIYETLAHPQKDA